MKVKRAIEKRRSIRDFKKDDISKEIIEDLLNCGILAPSAKNRQPWFFVVIKDQRKNEVADLMLEYIQNTSENWLLKNSKTINTIKETANIIKQAPVLILIFRPKDDYWKIGDSLSIGACIENMYLRATELGIGCLAIRDIVFVSKKVEKMVNHENLEFNCAVALGIPDKSPMPKDRKKVNDITEWY